MNLKRALGVGGLITIAAVGLSPVIARAQDSKAVSSEEWPTYGGAALEAELLKPRRFTSQAEAKMACFSHIEGWYNPVRLHSALAYRSPITYEADKEAAPTET